MLKDKAALYFPVKVAHPPFAPYGEMYDNIGATTNVNFTGDNQDLVAGTFDTPSRELNPHQGRWISPDPAHAAWNAYAYSANPLTSVDSSGLDDGGGPGGGGIFDAESSWWADSGSGTSLVARQAAQDDTDEDKRKPPASPVRLSWWLAIVRFFEKGKGGGDEHYFGAGGDGDRWGPTNERYHMGPTYLRMLTDRMMGPTAGDSQNSRLFTAFLVMGGGISSGPAEIEETTILYRAVSKGEYDDLVANKVFRPGQNSYVTGRFFAETPEAAAEWGTKLEGPGKFRVIKAEFPKSVADKFMRWDRLDGIGPARFATFDQIQHFTLHFIF
jgi:RHS repeat-associated protein